MARKQFYFSTRDLLMMAALAALGGVTSTYINALGDLVQSVVGFAGATQWAAGLHVLWLVLAVGLTRKQGAGTLTGILKGAVELLSGNTHGILVLLVDLVAGILVDLGVLLFRRKDSPFALAVAGGLASASNIFVFQLFASLPADLITYGALLIVALVAFASGVLFAGLLGHMLINALRRSGAVKDHAPEPMGRALYGLLLGIAIILTFGLGAYLRHALRGPETISIGGQVQTPFEYPLEHGDLPEIIAEATLRGVTARYAGVALRELIARAQPDPNSEMILVQASDGYAFFISMEELQENPSLLLAMEGKGEKASFNLVGPENSKAWIRGVSEIIVVGSATLRIEGKLETPGEYVAADWQYEMDGADLDLGSGPRKAQGAALSKVLEALHPLPEANIVLFEGNQEQASLPLSDVLADEEIRIFTIIDADGLSFAIARMNSTVLLKRVNRIIVQ